MVAKESPSKTEIAYHGFRSLLYGTLGTCWYTFPDKTFVESVVRQGIFNVFDYIEGLDVFNKGIKKVHRWVNDVSKDTLEDIQRTLSLDYTRLFMGPGKVLAPPWESVYCSPDGILFQEPTIKVRESYLKTGFTLSKKTPEDHIGLELMFMRILIKKYLDAKHKKERKDILDMQKDFLARHIQSWVSKFCKDVANNAKTDFYKGLAMMTEGFIQFEVSRIIDVSS